MTNIVYPLQVTERTDGIIAYLNWDANLQVPYPQLTNASIFGNLIISDYPGT